MYYVLPTYLDFLYFFFIADNEIFFSLARSNRLSFKAIYYRARDLLTSTLQSHIAILKIIFIFINSRLVKITRSFGMRKELCASLQHNARMFMYSPHRRAQGCWKMQSTFAIIIATPTSYK